MNIRRPVGAFVLAIAVAGLTGCSDITGSNDATITVENNASVSVWRIYIAECDHSTWGDDRLGSDETIRPGNERRFRIDDGCWDMRAEFTDRTFAQDFGVRLDEGDNFTWELVD